MGTQYVKMRRSENQVVKYYLTTCLWLNHILKWWTSKIRIMLRN